MRGDTMGPPLYITSLIGLMHNLGWPQQRIAEQLGISKTAVSLWASGARPLSKRHEQPFLDLVEAVLREAQAGYHIGTPFPDGILKASSPHLLMEKVRQRTSDDHIQELYRWVDTWSKEMFVQIMRYQQAIESALKVVQQFDVSRQVLTLAPDERQRLRGACQEVLRYLDYCESLGLPGGITSDKP
jgi:transcriptional regulator with XRE-family HTH domain